MPDRPPLSSFFTSPRPPLSSFFRTSVSDPLDDEEERFRSWYEERAKRLSLDPNPDDPRHHYDYRAAFRAGAEPGADGHWPSEFKAPDHPRRYLFLGGVLRDTETGKAVRETDPGYSSARAAAVAADGEPGEGRLPMGDATERQAGFSDYVDRFGTAVLFNVSAPLDLAGAAAGLAARSPLGFLMPGGPRTAAAAESAAGAAQRGLAGVERATGLPFTSASQQQHRERFRELEKPLQPLAEALLDTGLEGAGVVADPGAAGLGAIKALRGVRPAAKALETVAGAAERRVAPALRAEVESLLPTLAGKTRPELRAMLDTAEPGGALEKAIERAAEQLEQPGAYSRPPAAAPPVATAEEATAKAERFRAAIAPRRGLGEPGGAAQVFGPSGESFDVRYGVLELEDLQPSHDLVAGKPKPNPRYPPELQPRDRMRIATAEQVDEMARTLQPGRLLDHPDIDAGAPIVDAQANVLSGNARAMGIREAYRRGLDEPYRAAVEERATALGIDPGKVAGMKRPVLVRTLTSPVEPRAFAELANKPRSMALAATEQALQDARRISPGTLEGFIPNADGEVASAANRDFVRTLLAEIAPSPAERAALQTATGELSQEGARRVRGAVLASAFPDSDAVARLIESTDDNIKGAGRAMLTNAPKIASQRAAMAAGARFAELDIAPAVGEASAKLSALRLAKEPVERFLAQTELSPSLSPAGRELLSVMHENRRSPRRLTAVLHRYTELVDDAGDPRQMGLFGAAEPPDPVALLRRANVEADLAGQRSMFDAAGAEAVAEPAERYVAQRARAAEPAAMSVRSPMGQPAVVGEAIREQMAAAPPAPPGGHPPFNGAPPGGQRPLPPRLAELQPRPTSVGARVGNSLRRFLADNFVSESAGASLEFRDPQVRRYIAHQLPMERELAQTEAAKIEIAAKPLFSRFERAVRDASGGDRAAAAKLRADTTLARTSREWDGLPEPVAAAGQEIGGFVDDLTRRYLDEGLLTKGQEMAFRDNLGAYLHRSYQAFDATDFYAKVRGTEQWGKAFAHLRDTMPEATDEELTGVLWQLATREEQKPPPAFGRRAFPRKDLTNLRERKDIAEPIRGLMGEYDDYLLNAGRTVGKMAYDLSMHRMYKRARGALEEMGAVVAPRRIDGRTVSPGGERMAAEIVGGAGTAPLDGMMTTPDLARFFNEAGAAAHTGLRSFFERSTGALKMGKTVWSPATQLRNAESWVLMTLAQGRSLRRTLRGGSPLALPGTEAGRNLMTSLRAVGGELAADVAPASRLAATLDESVLRAKSLRAAELGVSHTGTNSGELAEWGRMFSGGGKGPVPAGSPAVEGVKGAARTVGRAGSGLYRASDDAGKFYNWLEEIEDLRWMHNDGRPEAQLEAEAAEIVKQQLQTYGRSIPLARKLAKNPLVGPFVTFQFEMPRNLINATKRGAYEIDLWRQTGNPRALAMGTARLAGVVTGFSAIAGLDMAMGTLGATAAGKAMGLEGAAHTSDDTEAVRRLTAPPWARYATPMILDIDRDGVTYVDGSGIDPYSVVPQLAVALTEPETAPEKLYALADVLTQRFMAPELAAKAGVEFVTKTRIEGPLWDADSREQTGNRAYNLWRTLGPGAALTGENVARGAGLLNPERGHGRRYELKSELAAALGPRVQTYSFEGAFKGRTTAWNQARRDVSAAYTREATRARPGTEDILDAKKAAEEDWREGWMQMQEWTNSTRQLLGKHRSQKEVEDTLWTWMRANDVSAVLARQLLSGQYMTYTDYRNRTARRGSPE